MRQDVVHRAAAGTALEEHFDEIMASAYSVSLFTRWGTGVDQVWVKSRGDRPASGSCSGPSRAGEPLHMLAGAHEAAVHPAARRARSRGRTGCRTSGMAFTPSRGEELQSEYLVPRARTPGPRSRRCAALRRCCAPLLQVAEIRTVAADDLWLSGAYGQDVVGSALHLAARRAGRCTPCCPHVEAALLPLGARPHWGKCFTLTGEDLLRVHPRLADLAALRATVDPGRKFSSAFTDGLLAAAEA